MTALSTPTERAACICAFANPPTPLTPDLANVAASVDAFSVRGKAIYLYAQSQDVVYFGMHYGWPAIELVRQPRREVLANRDPLEY